MNHSCDPNAGLKEDREMVALREIQPGEEVAFDYSTTMSERHWTMPCACGAAGCRKVVGDFHELPILVQQRYLQLAVVQRRRLFRLNTRSLSIWRKEWSKPCRTLRKRAWRKRRKKACRNGKRRMSI